ncbi:hypothetical protein [Kitasatospora sp. NPDC059599]|uniref:hypothetical protein n=1 Tax=Kitasatospora sp. NPDC059599 TaxID=3346880 RepID=UPI0036CD0406
MEERGAWRTSAPPTGTPTPETRPPTPPQPPSAPSGSAYATTPPKTGVGRYDPDHDTVLQHALRRERHRQDVADRARQITDVAHRRLAGTAAQPLYTALDRVGLHPLTDDDHRPVRDLTRHVDPATLRQAMSWLERTRTAAFALRGAEPTRPARHIKTGGVVSADE